MRNVCCRTWYGVRGGGGYDIVGVECGVDLDEGSNRYEGPVLVRKMQCFLTDADADAAAAAAEHRRACEWRRGGAGRVDSEELDSNGRRWSGVGERAGGLFEEGTKETPGGS